jgi:cytochrome c-type biogenesis protein CcmH
MIPRLAPLVAIVAALAGLGAGSAAAAAGSRPSLLELEGELMCPTCHTTLDQSDAPIAKRIEAFIRRRIAAGDSKDEIVQKLVAQFGTAILAAPPRRGLDLLVWWLPFVGLGLGAVFVTVSVWRWHRANDDSEGVELEPLDLDAELRALVDRELERLET